MENNPTPNPIEPDKITNSDESEVMPGTEQEIQPPVESDETDKEYEGAREAGNVAAEEENETDELDGSNANNIRTK